MRNSKRAYHFSKEARRAVADLLLTGSQVSFGFVAFNLKKAPRLMVKCTITEVDSTVTAWGNTMTKALQRAHRPKKSLP